MNSNPRFKLAIALGALAFILAGVIVIVSLSRTNRNGPGPDDAPDDEPLTFAGDSQELKKTVIVPTLDTPIPEAKSAIWCLSFQVAWDRLKGEAGEPPIVDTAEDVCRRLNAAKASENDLVPETYYAMAGSTRDGIQDRIRREMAAKFPGVSVPEFTSEEAIIAYGYLAAGVKYPLAYEDTDRALAFRDPADKTIVRSHGLSESTKNKRPLRDQPEVLYLLRTDQGWGYSDQEFALDLCKDSQPHQIVLARVPRKSTLAETLADVEAKIAAHAKGPRRVSGHDSLLVPNMRWKITHHFGELETHTLANTRYKNWIVKTAIQVIDFKIDRRGASVESEGRVEVYKDKGPSYRYHFDGPYLLYLKKRGAANPLLVMWIDNAELLSKK